MEEECLILSMGGFHILTLMSFYEKGNIPTTWEVRLGKEINVEAWKNIWDKRILKNMSKIREIVIT